MTPKFHLLTNTAWKKAFYPFQHFKNQSTLINSFISNAVRLLSTKNSKMEEEVSQRQIRLSDVERRLQRLLLDVAKSINPKKPSELRFTGGWVRDKLLNVDSHDIDVGINDMTGYQFGLRMKSYLEHPGNAEKHGLQGVATSSESAKSQKIVDESKMVHGLHRIEANPEKSKHLETVTTKIFGLDIDLVNLRKETYTEESRNPQMEFGTPREDALRRDATVNALFYNIQTDQVEDLTGWGIHDMQKGIIRTPLDPYQTFKDDPLRVLRLIRFATRLNYTINPDAEQAMGNEDIKVALRLKISRERIGIELEKMLQGPNPRKALADIDDYGLYHTIFIDPTTSHSFDPDTSKWNVAYECLAKMSERDMVLRDVLLTSFEMRYISWLLSAFVPYSDAPIGQPSKQGGKSPPPLAAIVAREGIKASHKICEVVTFSCNNLEDIINTKDRFIKSQRLQKRLLEEHDPTARDVLGMAIRRWGSSWRSQVLFAILVEVTRYEESQTSVLEGFELFVSQLKKLDLLNAYDLKTIVDGKTLSQALGTKPGPWMKDALDVIMAWQLRNPENANAEDAIEQVKKKHGELTNSLIRHFLRLTIRPLFSNTQTHQNITAQGRNTTTTPMPQRSYVGAEIDETKVLWKDERNRFAVDLLTWTVQRLNTKNTEENWPLLVPPILTLVDDIDTAYKTKGCILLSLLFDATSPDLLQRTGLGQVFEEAITPCLSYLPTLTPLEESIKLLNVAYPCLLKSLELRFPRKSIPRGDRMEDKNKVPVINAQFELESIRKNRVKYLNNHLHQNILPSISHVVDSHPTLTMCLLNHLSSFIKALSIDCIPNLMHLVPILTSILTSPFAPQAYPLLLSQAIQTLQVLIANTWPRIWYWRGDILKGLCICWVRVVEEEEDQGDESSSKDNTKIQQLAEVKTELILATKMLRNAVQTVQDGTDLDKLVPEELRVAVGEINWDMEIGLLAETEPKLKLLFGS